MDVRQLRYFQRIVERKSSGEASPRPGFDCPASRWHRAMQKQ